MEKLMLSSLEIRGFRGFRHLQIERLGRVNLVVGKNNVGKTGLLEALRLYARKGHPDLIWDILKARDESANITAEFYDDMENALSSLKYLFYGRKNIQATIHTNPIFIGPLHAPQDALVLSIDWYKRDFDEAGNLRGALPLSEYPPLFDNLDIISGLEPRLTVRVGRRSRGIYPIYPGRSASPKRIGLDLKEINAIYIGANGIDNTHLSILWSNVSLRDLEKEVLSALRIVSPGIEALNIVGEATRMIIVKLDGIDDPLPLRSLGNGMFRVLSIALALVNARNGLLLIDEIENGLHYSIQPEIWRLIFQLAHRLNVQIFATTHSWDCIEGFQKAAQNSSQENAVLIRLEIKNGDTISTLFDKRRLAIATREKIEVR